MTEYDNPGGEQVCEGCTYWEEDGKSGIIECDRTDVEYCERNGEAGWFCPDHQP